MNRKTSPGGALIQNPHAQGIVTVVTFAEKGYAEGSKLFCTAWGLASKGQLGCAFHSLKSINAIKVPPLGDGFFDISCGENHSLILGENLQMYSTGSNTYGQLGIGVNSHSQSPIQNQQIQTTIHRIKQFVGESQSSSDGQKEVQTEKSFEAISCGSEHSFGLTYEGELYAWGLNFKGQLGLGDFENRSEPYVVETLFPIDGSGAQSKQNILQMIKRSKSKEGQAPQRNANNNEEMKFSHTMNIEQQKSHQRNNQGSTGVGGASKSIFNQSYKELKPSKSVDLSNFNNTGTTNQYDEQLFNQLGQKMTILDSPTNQYLLKMSEKVIKVACGSIHTLVLTNHQRLFSCGNGSTFALGHKTRESCSTFKQIEYFNGGDDQGNANATFKTIACGLSHSGCVLEDGSVYLWGICGDIQYSKEFMEKCLLKKPTKVQFKSQGDPGQMSHRRRSAAASDDLAASIQIEDLRLGEQFSLALSTKGIVYAWGQNDKGQLGLANENPCCDPAVVSGINKSVIAIDCGLKHVLAITMDKKLWAWGSNLQSQLGKKTLPQQPFLNAPVVVTAFENARPKKIACGSYHNICLSEKMPQQEEVEVQESENKLIPSKKQNQEGTVQPFTMQHSDEDCPHLQTIAKLKAEIKRLRIDLVSQGPSKKAQKSQNQMLDDSDQDSEESGFGDEYKAALKVLSNEQRKIIADLEQSGANKKYLVKKIKQFIELQQEQQVSVMGGTKTFEPCYEINYNEITLDRKISEGGYGIVYRGRWKHTTVAIKEIKREIIEQDKLEEFKNECAVMEVIRHPNIVLFLGACTKIPNLAIILEFCSRGSLWSLLHDQSIKLNWDYRKKFALDIAKGVYYLHTNKQPILHRDLKSLNVLLDHALNCKLADFGWTRIKAKVMTSKIGTYQWMAPEVINGFKYTEKADVFSFGVILWELATRKPPYYGIDGQVVSQKVVKEGLRPKISEKESPGPFLDLMKRCWHENPDKRPSFGEIIGELEQMNFKNIQ